MSAGNLCSPSHRCPFPTALVHRSIHWLFFNTWNSRHHEGHRDEKPRGCVARTNGTTVWLRAVSVTVETGRCVSRCLIPCHNAEVAQSVEHMTENHGVGSSILPLGTIFVRKMADLRIGHFCLMPEVSQKLKTESKHRLTTVSRASCCPVVSQPADTINYYLVACWSTFSNARAPARIPTRP